MRRWWIWIFPVALASVIVWLSAQSTLPGAVALPPPLDKVAHACAFGVLAFVLDLACRWTLPGLPMYRRHLYVMAFVALFGATDEWHQRFVPGRSCDTFDWMADVMGGLMALALSLLPYLWTRKLGGASWRRGKPWRQDPSRPLILVADPHWSEELTGLREASNAYGEADWLFLGDVFDVWVGLPGLETDAQRAFLWWVSERRAAGRWVGLWLGNREYFLDVYARRFDHMGEGVGGELPQERLAFEHGDLINAADRKYRFWNLLSHSGTAWLLVRALPRALAVRLTAKLERSMAATNRSHKLAFPREAFKAALAEHPEGWTFLTGHFHSLQEEGKGIALPWAREGGFWIWDGTQVYPMEVPRPSTARET